MSRASVLQGALAVHLLASRLELDLHDPAIVRGIFVIDDPFGHVDGYSAYGVDEFDKCLEIQPHVAVDVHAEALLEARLHKRRATIRRILLAEDIDRVDALHAIARHLNEDVARDREQADIDLAWRDVHEHNAVCARDPALAIARIHAQDYNIERLWWHDDVHQQQGPKTDQRRKQQKQASQRQTATPPANGGRRKISILGGALALSALALRWPHCAGAPLWRCAANSAAKQGGLQTAGWPGGEPLRIIWVLAGRFTP